MKPMIRNTANTAWIDNFCTGGWKVKMGDGSWLTMTAANTKIRNADNTDWLTFTCSVDPTPPAGIEGATLSANRLVDNSGYLWCTGMAVGRYEDGTTNSWMWKKVKHQSTGQYVKNVKAVYSIGGSGGQTYVFTLDNKVLFAGIVDYGASGAGSIAPNPDLSMLIDVTTQWTSKLGPIADITSFDRLGLAVAGSGKPYTIGLVDWVFDPGGSTTKTRNAGHAGSNYSISRTSGNTTIYAAAVWSPLRYSGADLPSIVSATKCNLGAQNPLVLAIKAGGGLVQSSYWTYSGTTLPSPTGGNVYELSDLGTTFSGGTPAKLHQGGILETTTGDLFYAKINGVIFWRPLEFVSLGINTNTLGSPVKKILGEVTPSGNYTVFILLNDGRLMAQGTNTDGWFGQGNETALSSLTQINTGVDNFDAVSRTAWVFKTDQTLWASGSNSLGALGINANPSTTTKVNTWTECVVG